MSIILGTMNIGYQYSSNKEKTYNSYKEIIEKYINSVDNPILDTAYYYGDTKTEVILGNILKDINSNKKITIATKANPWYKNDFTNGILGQLSPYNLERQLNKSLNSLQLNSVDIFYLHCPDYETPIKDTLEKCNQLWRNEKFNKLGISNFSKNQLEEIIDICDKNQYEIPRYYQGMYNLISRKVEEIFPILDKYNIEFWAYNPLAGGLLTNKYNKNINEINNEINDDSRFKNNKIYQNIFLKENILDSLDDFFKLNNPIERSFQWLLKYSKLRPNDKVILGVSTIEQLDNNLKSIHKNILYNTDIINKLNNIYSKIENNAPNYYY
jgi:aflatoxin B1 aldehyde reductase